jgi:hypothetical protein
MTVRIETHHDSANNEYVLRVVNIETGSYAGIGALNGKHEADIIQRVLQGAIELHYSSKIMCDFPADHIRRGFVRGMKNADNLVGGVELEELL